MRHKFLTPSLSSLRVTGGASVAFGPGAPVSRLASLAESGGYRVKFPAPEDRAEAVLINTGGGVAGGDRVSIDVALQPGAALTVTTQSAERIYRSLGDAAHIDVRLDVGEGADLAYLPQETILFSHANLRRSITVEVAATGKVLLAEMIVFGRAAMGETVVEGALHDSWRIRRGGKLVYADEVRLQGPMHALLQHAALGGAAGAVATLLYVAPDGPDRLNEARSWLESATCRAAASTWNGLLCLRLLGDPSAVRKSTAAAIAGLSRRPLPRVWSG